VLAGDLYVKQLFGQINLQLRRLAQGQAGLPDAMLRDALFFIAAAPQATAKRRCCAAPSPGRRGAGGLHARRYGKVDPAALKEAKEALARSKADWDQLALHPTMRAKPNFKDALSTPGRRQRKARRPGAGATAARTRAGRATRWPQTAATSSGLEMATAMLFVEHGLDQVRQLPDDFARTCRSVGQRLLALAAGETPPDAPQWQNELARQIQQGQTVAVLAGEIKSGLRQVEKLLDEYYDEPQAQARRAGRGRAAAAPDGGRAEPSSTRTRRRAPRSHVREAVGALAGGDGDVQAQAPALHNIARNIGALGFFTDMLAQNSDSAKSRFVFDAQAGLLQELSYGAATAPPQQEQNEQPAPAPAQEAGTGPHRNPRQPSTPSCWRSSSSRPRKCWAGGVDAARVAAQPGCAGCADDRAARLPHAQGQRADGRPRGLRRAKRGARTGAERVARRQPRRHARTAGLDRTRACQLAPWVAELAQSGASGRDGAHLIAAAERVQAGGSLADPVEAEVDFTEADGRADCGRGSGR
jgi:chemosensory pili system protein ChpA (sensor histidine kinase/response regulator)